MGTNGGGKNGFGGKKKSSAKFLLADLDLSELLVVGLVLNTVVLSGDEVNSVISGSRGWKKSGGLK